MREETIRDLIKNFRNWFSEARITNPWQDNSLDFGIRLPRREVERDQTKFSRNGVPIWENKTILSHKDINSANGQQRGFYEAFKKEFLKKKYYHIDDNDNYAFILIYDLINDYNKYDISDLEDYIHAAEYFYPCTNDFGSRLFVEKIIENSDEYALSRLTTETKVLYRKILQENSGLAAEYKNKLSLNKAEIGALSNLGEQTNSFTHIEFCQTEVVKLYLIAFKALDIQFKIEDSSLEKEIDDIADLVCNKIYGYNAGTGNYNYYFKNTANIVYVDIYKTCEDKVRNVYGAYRKHSPNNILKEKKVIKIYEKKITSKLEKILKFSESTISPLDEKTNLQLHKFIPNRWKYEVEKLTSEYNGNPPDFFEAVKKVEKGLRENVVIINILLESAKFIAKTDRDVALKLYLQYVLVGTELRYFQRKEFPKTLHKKLFSTDEQLQNFEIIVNNLLANKKIEKALEDLEDVFSVKRKKITIDTEAIQEAAKAHSETVVLLNEYLEDEEEKITKSEKFKAPAMSKSGENEKLKPKNDIFSNELLTFKTSFLTPIQTEVLNLFGENNFTVTQAQLEAFAKSKGLFKNQLVESVNDACFDILDDVLIEENGKNYSMSENYYTQVLEHV